VTPLVVGHRGAMGSCPENTLLSFERAAEMGAEWVELDVHQSRDGALVVIHDQLLERTTNGSGRVADHTLAELKSLDAGQGQSIPTLNEVLVWARQRGIGVDIEVKQAPARSVVEAAADFQPALITSFDHPLVSEIKRLAPRLRTGLLYAHRPLDPVGMAHAADAAVLLPQWPYVHPADVRTLHAAGLQVWTWATSDRHALSSLVAMGVDAIATNDPWVLRELLSRRAG
jgi:glycerophosphoryl diester phosphodiesterase